MNKQTLRVGFLLTCLVMLGAAVVWSFLPPSIKGRCTLWFHKVAGGNASLEGCWIPDAFGQHEREQQYLRFSDGKVYEYRSTGAPQFLGTYHMIRTGNYVWRIEPAFAAQVASWFPCYDDRHGPAVVRLIVVEGRRAGFPEFWSSEAYKHPSTQRSYMQQDRQKTLAMRSSDLPPANAAGSRSP